MSATPQPAHGSAEADVQLAMALFDYSAMEADELTLVRGETMVIYGSPEEGWYECELRGRVGMIPANYVRLLHAAELRQDASTLGSEGRRRGQSSRHGGSRDEDDGLKRLKSHETMGGAASKGRTGPDTSWETGLGDDEDMDKRKKVYDRLYHQGVVKVKRQQHLQEQKRVEEDEQIRRERQQVNAKSMKMAASRKPDQGTNYGEFLYTEGLERRDIKSEQVRLIKHNEQREQEKEATFTPRISKTSKALRRDMPVVERLFMLEQVKAEKIDTLKRSREREQRQNESFAPRTNARHHHPQQGTRAELAKSHLDTQKKEFHRQVLQDKYDREQGVTHKPELCARSRQLAARASTAQDSNIFQRLHKEAEEREMRYEVKRIEAHLVALDLASSTVRKGGVGVARDMEGGNGIDRAGEGGGDEQERGEVVGGRDDKRHSGLPLWEILHAESISHELRRQELARKVEQNARDERRGQKMNVKSQDLSLRRLRKECRTVLEHMGFLSETPTASESVERVGVDDCLLEFAKFATSLDVHLAENSHVGQVIKSLPQETRDAVYSSLWLSIAPLRPEEDSQDEDEELVGNGKEAIPGERLVDFVIRVNRGDHFHLCTRETEVGRLSLEVMQALGHMVTGRRLSNTSKPLHLLQSEHQSLLQRREKLNAAAAAEFAKCLRELGSNLNDLEISILFDYFELETSTLKYQAFASSAKGILTPRRRAIERMFRKLDSGSDGTVLISSLVGNDVRRESKTPRGGGGGKTPRAAGGRREYALENISNKLKDVSKRLKEVSAVIPVDIAAQDLLDDKCKDRSKIKRQSGENLEKQRDGEQEGGIGDERSQRRGLDGHVDEIPRHEMLHDLWRKKFEVMFAARQKQDEREMQHCTFRPQLKPSTRKTERSGPIGERLYYQSKSADKSYNSGKNRTYRTFEERELEQCTFRPHLVSRRPQTATSRMPEQGPDVGGSAGARYKEDAAQRHIQRVRRSSAAKELQYASEGKYSDVQVPAAQKTPRTPRDRAPGGAPTSPQAPTLATQQRKQSVQQQPLLCVDINIGDGQVGRVAIHEGDNGDDLATDFCRQYDLDGSTRDILAVTLQEQIDSLMQI